MCGGGGNYGDVAQGIAGMFGSSPTAAGAPAPVATAPTPSGDTMSGIGSYMPMQQAVQSYAPTAGFTPGQQLPSEALYDPMAAAQARMATMPQTRAMSVAELTPNATAEGPDMSDYLTRKQAQQAFDDLVNTHSYQGYNRLGIYDPMRDMRP